MNRRDERPAMCESCGPGNLTPPELPVFPGDPGIHDRSRRAFLLFGLLAVPLLPTLAGCAQAGTGRAMPGPHWKPMTNSHGGSAASSTPTTMPAPSTTMPGVIARTRWTSAPPHLPSVNPMTPIHSITVHHDGMRPYYDAHESATISRLETIRRSHRENQKWGDIGYHFAVDRSGRVYECRSLRYQGAHVKDHNAGNIGVLALGNFDEQQPTEAQLVGLREHLIRLMHSYNIPPARVRTHKEWQGARTACPGRSLQQYVDYMRSRRMLG